MMSGEGATAGVVVLGEAEGAGLQRAPCCQDYERGLGLLLNDTPQHKQPQLQSADTTNC